MHHDWAICACLQFKHGELLDKNKPFGTYHIEANSGEEAIQKLKDEFPCCNVTTYGKPVHSVITDEEYDNC